MSIYIAESIITIAYVLIKKAAVAAWDDDKNLFRFIRTWYYWFEFMFVIFAGVLAPAHSIDDGIMTVCLCIFIKICLDNMKFIDAYLCRVFAPRDKLRNCD